MAIFNKKNSKKATKTKVDNDNVENNENETVEKVSFFEKMKNVQIGGKKDLSNKEVKTDYTIGSYPVADLMPRYAKENKEKTWAKRRWTFIFVLSLIISVFIVFLSFAWNIYNSAQYESERLNNTAVQNEIEQYSDINSALEARNNLERLETQASDLEVNWKLLIDNIEEGLPDSSSISQFSAINGGNPDTDNVVAVLVTIISTQPLDYADIAHTTPNAVSVELGGFSRVSAPNSEEGTASNYTYDVAFGFDERLLNNTSSDENDTSSEIDNDVDIEESENILDSLEAIENGDDE